MPGTVISLRSEDTSLIQQLAPMVHDAFVEHALGWLPTVEAAREELIESLQPNRVSRVMINSRNRPVGWIGAIRQHSGRVWEIHPLMVTKSEQGKGYGRALVNDIEQLARNAGVFTLWAGTSDQTNATSLSGVDLYQDVTGAIANVRNIKRHVYEFWVNAGFKIVGVMPDAEGMGKPGIHLAKRLAAEP